MSVYRKIIDGLVIVVVIFVFGPYLLDFLPTTYEDTTIPDDILLLEEKIEARFDSIGGDFETLLANPVPLENYQFEEILSRTPLTAQKIYEQSIDGVVYINTIGIDGFWYTGSGTVVTKDGLILTNYHVIADSEKVLVVTTSGEIYEVESVVAYDPLLDIAFLKIDANDLSPLPLGDSDALRVGDTTYSIGHAEGLINTFSGGIISGFRDYSSLGEGTQIQITNPTSGGNSGGALLNQYGELVGVPTSILEYEYNVVQVQNINFAVPINSALELLR